MISILALVFAMSGTAYAATGGTFLLGKANTAGAVTGLANTSGTALSLTAPANTPPLTVNNGTQVPNLNASKLGGQPPSAFLPAAGRAADSSKLGGIPATGYMQGTGSITGSRVDLQTGSKILATIPGGTVQSQCFQTGGGYANSYFVPAAGNPVGSQAMWWNKDGARSYSFNYMAFPAAKITPDTADAYMIVLRIDNLTSISTVTITQWMDPPYTANMCHFTAQTVTTNG